MPKKVEIDKENQMLHVQFSSDSKIEDWKSAHIQVERMSEETGIRRILVDIRKQMLQSSTSEFYEIGTLILKSVAIAVLCDINDPNYHFIETVAKNRGKNAKLFNSKQDAIEWLKKCPNKSMGNAKK